jgi:hypothetical protein
VSALLARQLSPVLNWDIATQYEHDTYGFGKENTVNVLTNVRWRVGPRLTLRFFAAHSNVSPNGYSDNQFGLTAGYALLPSSVAPPQGTEGLQPIDRTSAQPLRY